MLNFILNVFFIFRPYKGSKYSNSLRECGSLRDRYAKGISNLCFPLKLYATPWANYLYYGIFSLCLVQDRLDAFCNRPGICSFSNPNCTAPYVARREQNGQNAWKCFSKRAIEDYNLGQDSRQSPPCQCEDHNSIMGLIHYVITSCKPK